MEVSSEGQPSKPLASCLPRSEKPSFQSALNVWQVLQPWFSKTYFVNSAEFMLVICAGESGLVEDAAALFGVSGVPDAPAGAEARPIEILAAAAIASTAKAIPPRGLSI